MAKIYVQSSVEVLRSTASLATSACISGSLISKGYSKLTGIVVSNASSAAGSGLRVLQSLNGGASWDIISASNPASACTASALSYDIYGDAVKVEYRNGATAASLFRTLWQLRPI